MNTHGANMPKTILILGGGFGGLNAALLLAHRVRDKEIGGAHIILVDRNDYHFYTPSLYEISSAEEEFTSVQSLKKSITIPFAEVLPPEVKFVKGEVEKIDHRKKQAQVNGKEIDYDYLVVALGSTSDDFKIPGVKSRAYFYKTWIEALRIRNQLEMLVDMHRLDVAKKAIKVVIGGAGFSGVELAGEMANFKKILSWKFNYPEDRIEIIAIEATAKPMPGADEEIRAGVEERLNRIGVQLILNTMITAVDDKQVHLNSGETINYDLFIWTAGVRGAEAPWTDAPEMHKGNRCVVNEYLQLPDDKSVYVIGDNACVMSPKGTPVATTASQAIDHAEYVAEEIPKQIRGEKLCPYRPKDFPFIAPIKGKWAVLHWPSGRNWFGFIPWTIKCAVAFRYYNRLMPTWSAFKLAWFDTRLYTRND